VLLQAQPLSIPTWLQVQRQVVVFQSLTVYERWRLVQRTKTLSHLNLQINRPMSLQNNLHLMHQFPTTNCLMIPFKSIIKIKKMQRLQPESMPTRKLAMPCNWTYGIWMRVSVRVLLFIVLLPACHASVLSLRLCSMAADPA
jgi:hypothetical protein